MNALESLWHLPDDGSNVPAYAFDLAQLFHVGCTISPEKEAFVAGIESYSFLELEKMANQLAFKLSNMGVGRSDKVVVLAEKHIPMPAIAVAIWKVGAVYVPIDKENPVKRNRQIIEDVEPALIIGGEVDHYPQCYVGKLLCDELRALFEGELTERSFNSPVKNSGDLAYIIFTSGSTGTPKGVMISHGSLQAYFYSHNQILQFSEDSRVLRFSPFHFDLSIEDTLLPLAVGATVYLFKGINLGVLIRKYMAQKAITHIVAVSTLLQLITEDGSHLAELPLPHLKTIVTGAELCDPAVTNHWTKNCPGIRLLNGYGPTEATINCASYTIDTYEPNRTKPYPFGTAMPGIVLRLVDENGQAIEAVEQPGELWVGGRQVMLGYLNRPEQTHQAIAVVDGVRYYKTGDICQFDENKQLCFIGRNDSEVKLDGKRIHLGEIRQQLLAQPGIKGAAVGVVKMSERDVIAAVVLAQSDCDLHQLNKQMAKQLPAWMMPKVWGVHAKAMVTSTGKSNEKGVIALLQQGINEAPGMYYRCLDSQQFKPINEKEHV